MSDELEEKLEATMEWLLDGCCPNCGEYLEDCDCGYERAKQVNHE